MIHEFLDAKTLAALLAGSFVVFKIVQWIQTELKIRALGGHARRIRTWLPFDIDLIIHSVRSALHHENHIQWGKWFSAADSYTAEATPAGLRIIFTADPENIKAILATQFGDYGKGEPFHEDWKGFLGDSIFTTDGDQWHQSRQLIRPLFIRERVSDLNVFEEHSQTLLRKISEGMTKGEVDVSDLFFRYTLDAATHFLLGKSVGSLDLPEQEFASAFAHVQFLQNLIARAGPLNLLIPRRSFNKGIKVIDEFVTQFIEKALALSPDELETKTKSEEGFTFLHSLAGYTRDRKILRDQLVAVLLAGRDTTASGLSWAFYELARNKEAYAKLRKEVEETVGLERAPTYEDLKGMKYLNNVISETLRMYPLVPFNVRLALRDCTLPRGGGPDGLSPIGILKDTNIAYSTLLMQRRADLYPAHSHPERFVPERWEQWQPRPWQYIPFNGGPRICIGQQFALTEMGYTICRLVQRFGAVESRMAALDGGVPVLKAEIVLQPGQGVRVAFLEGQAGVKGKA